jgi:hypothetical protein
VPTVVAIHVAKATRLPMQAKDRVEGGAIAVGDEVRSA